MSVVGSGMIRVSSSIPARVSRVGLSHCVRVRVSVSTIRRARPAHRVVACIVLTIGGA
jgi:hypothetical protein